MRVRLVLLSFLFCFVLFGVVSVPVFAHPDSSAIEYKKSLQEAEQTINDLKTQLVQIQSEGSTINRSPRGKKRSRPRSNSQISSHSFLAYVLGIINVLMLLAVIAFIFRNKRIKRTAAGQVKSERDQHLKRMREKLAQEQYLKEKLDSRKKDLTNLVLTIERKDNFIKELIHQLKKILSTPPGEIKAKIHDLLRYANRQLRINEDVTLLHKNIETISEEFYSTLDEQFDNLTINEKHLCGLIRLNLTNKEIADIRGISVNSAKMNRYRLRKKLSLSPEEDIVEFLQKL